MSDNVTNQIMTLYRDGARRTCFDVDELIIRTPAGDCWLHLELLDDGDETGRQAYSLNVAGQQVNILVAADGTARLNDALEVMA